MWLGILRADWGDEPEVSDSKFEIRMTNQIRNSNVQNEFLSASSRLVALFGSRSAFSRMEPGFAKRYQL
jgi:hypothetical protein